MSNRSQSTRRTQPMPPTPSSEPIVNPAEDVHFAPPPSGGGARFHGRLQVAAGAVGRFDHGEVLSAEQIAEFSQDRLNVLVRDGALVPLGASAPGPPQRPLPAEDAALQQAAAQAQASPPLQDFDQRPGQPRAG